MRRLYTIGYPLNAKRGAVLIMTFIIMATLMAMTAGFLFMTSGQLRGSAHDVASSKAFWLAEAGLQDVIQKLTSDSDYRDSPTAVISDFGDGNYSVTVTKDGTTYTLASTGTVDVISRKITMSVVATSAVIERGIHADGAHLKFDDSSGTINGDVSCFISVMNEDDMTITGTITEGQDQPKINPALDITGYYTIADAAGQVDTRKTFENATYTGVWYITQQATIGDDATINGTIICEGNINFEGKADNVTITPTNNYPALYSGGTIMSTDTGSPAQRIGLQNSTINGLVMATSNIIFDYMNNNTANTVTFTGTLLAVNNIEIKNSSNFTVTYDADIWDPLPLGFSFTSTASVTEQGDWNEVVPAT